MSHFTRTVSVLAVAVLAAACGKDGEDIRKAPPKTPPVVAGDGDGGVVPGGPAVPARKPTPDLAEAEIRAVVDAWLAAQNAGDLVAYEKLYAAKFAGIKRVGFRSFQFDRARWLKDRARMFKNKMTVTADQVVIHATPALATVELVQSFTQGKFSDKGPKQLLVVKTPEGLRIAREEMLASQVLSAPQGKPVDVDFVLDVDGTSWVVLEVDTEVTGTGKLTPITGHGPMFTLDPIDPAKAAAEVTAWTGKPVQLHDGKTACAAKLGEVAVLAVATPHFGTVQHWDGDADAGEAPLSPAERAAALYQLGSHMLVAKVDGACKGGWAQLGDKAGVVFATAAPDAATATAATAAFRALPAYKDLQTDFTTNYGGTGEWTEGDDGSLEVKQLASPDGKLKLIAVHAEAGAGCGDFSGALTAFFEVGPGGKLTLVGEPSTAGMPVGAIDFDSNGVVELVVPNGLLERTSAGWQLTSTLDLRDLDCPC